MMKNPHEIKRVFLKGRKALTKATAYILTCQAMVGVLIGAFVLIIALGANPANAITIDGVISPGEWSGAEVVITDPNEPASQDDNYDLNRVMLADGHYSFYVGLTVYGDHPALAAQGSQRPYLDFYFNMCIGGAPPYRFGLTYNNGYGFDPGDMHLIQYDENGWEDLGTVDFVIDKVVEVHIPWSMLPPELFACPAIAVQSLFFLYNVAPGDANADGMVNVGDLGILAGNYGTIGNASWSDADFNLDRSVNVADLGILAGHYGFHAAGGALYDIFDDNTMIDRNLPLTKHAPEPVTLIGVFMGLLGVAGYIRKHRRA